jgi:uncharacterized protein involved in exopolysaccharide biosynthesis
LTSNDASEPAIPTTDAISILLLVWQKKWLVAACMVAAFFGGIVYLNIAIPTYTTELRVTAATSSSGSIANRLGNLGGLAAAAGLGIGSSSKAEPFDLYLEALTSRGVADKLAADQHIMTTIFSREWDDRRKAWVAPPLTTTQSVKSLLGLREKPWRPPDGARLRDYLLRELVITKNTKTPVTAVGYDARDPDFGVYLLTKLDEYADLQVRSRALQQARDYQSYLTSVLPGVLIADARRSLAESLVEQYEAVMMAQSTVSYAAVALSKPQASIGPTKPKAMIVIALSLLLGLVVGLMLAIVDFRGIAARARNLSV